MWEVSFNRGFTIVGDRYLISITTIKYCRTWIVVPSRDCKIGTHYQRYLLSKVLSMVLHEVGTEQGVLTIQEYSLTQVLTIQEYSLTQVLTNPGTY